MSDPNESFIAFSFCPIRPFSHHVTMGIMVLATAGLANELWLCYCKSQTYPIAYRIPCQWRVALIFLISLNNWGNHCVQQGLKNNVYFPKIKALEHKVPIKLSSNAKHTYSSLPDYVLAFPNYMAFALSGMSSCALLMYCDPTHILRLSEPPSSPLILGSRSHPKRALSFESVCTGSDRHVHVEWEPKAKVAITFIWEELKSQRTKWLTYCNKMLSTKQSSWL